MPQASGPSRIVVLLVVMLLLSMCGLWVCGARVLEMGAHHAAAEGHRVIAINLSSHPAV